MITRNAWPASSSDSPEHAPGHRRIWLGRADDDAATLALMDAAGRKRLVFEVPAQGDPNLLFLDTNGNVVRQLAPVRK